MSSTEKAVGQGPWLVIQRRKRPLRDDVWIFDRLGDDLVPSDLIVSLPLALAAEGLLEAGNKILEMLREWDSGDKLDEPAIAELRAAVRKAEGGAAPPQPEAPPNQVTREGSPVSKPVVEGGEG